MTRYLSIAFVLALFASNASAVGKIEVMHNGKIETCEVTADNKVGKCESKDAAKWVVNFSADITDPAAKASILSDLRAKNNAGEGEVATLISFIGAAKGGLDGMKNSDHPIVTGAVGAVKGAFGF